MEQCSFDNLTVFDRVNLALWITEHSVHRGVKFSKFLIQGSFRGGTDFVATEHALGTRNFSRRVDYAALYMYVGSLPLLSRAYDGMK